ncbi:PilW family protein [Variovorax atrisoli]|uniref:PilW family protein n=1 Tax=Variovorax atrisoli TaxID=3394203 RepID=UPI0033937988
MKSRAPSGFTLVEFLVALVVGMLIVLAAIAAMLGTRSTAMTGDDVNTLNQSSALAFRMLGQQIRQAGYIPIDPTEPLYYFNTSADRGTNLTDEQSFFAVKGVESADGSNDKLKLGYAPNPDYFKDCLGQEPGRSSGGEYDRTEPEAQGNARLITSEFSVSNGTLRCQGSGNATPQPVIDGVERFDVMYGVSATSGSRQVVRYVTADGVDDGFSNVRTVRICLQLAGASRSNPAGSHVDCDGVSKTSSDGRLRRVYTAVFSLRNDLGAL